MPTASLNGNVAPWIEDKENAVDKELENERFKRIGILPSPAFGGSMISGESNETRTADENDDTISHTEGPSGHENSILEQGNHDTDVFVADVVVALAELSTTHEVPASDVALDLPAIPPSTIRSLPDTVSLERSISPEKAPEVNTSPTRRAVPRQTASQVQPPSRRSSVSSLHSDEKDILESSVPLDRNVSPLRDRPEAHLPGTREPAEIEDAAARRDDFRPPLIGRGSLPSQQRPQSRPRQSSWQWKNSGTSLSALDKAQGDVVPAPMHGRSMSGQYNNSVPVSRAASPVSFLEMAPAQKEEGAIALGNPSTDNLRASSVPPFEAPTTSVPHTFNPVPPETGRMAPIVQSPVEMQTPWQSNQTYPPMAHGSYAKPAPMYAQSNSMSKEQVIYEEPVNRTFSPTVLDPRQHGIEYQLPGVGPPEEYQGPRRSRFSIRSPVNPVQVGRINPNAVSNDNQRTFSGDEIPLTQAAQEKREKRRPGVLGRLSSRGSSFSGLSALIPDGRQSSSNDGAQAGSQQQTPEVLRAGESSNGGLRGKTLRKMQRSSTSAGPSSAPGTPEPEKKNKRFSRLGSLFGRSNSETKKANKLVKIMPAKPEPEREAAPSTWTKTMQNIPAPPMKMGYGMEPPQQWVDQSDVQSGQMVPSGGWYAPTSHRSSYHQDQQATLPQIQPTVSGQSWQSQQQQPVRRLHSEGYRHEPRYTAPQEYRSMSPSPLRGQRGSEQYDTTTPQMYQRTPSWNGGPRQQPSLGNGNYSWGSGEHQQQQGYMAANAMANAAGSRYSPAGTPTHSRNASFASLNNVPLSLPQQAPPLYRNSSSGALQRSSSPSMYGLSHPYQVPVPAPATDAQLMAKTQQEWYARYTAGSPGPAQQASMPGMYTHVRSHSGSGNGSGSGANHVRMNSGGYENYAVVVGGGYYGGGGGGGGGGSRPGSAGGFAMPQHALQSHGGAGIVSQPRRYYGSGGSGGGGAVMGPRPYTPTGQQPYQ
jgi:hypothetical protein